MTLQFKEVQKEDKMYMKILIYINLLIFYSYILSLSDIETMVQYKN
jgi:hypothetical protein